MNIYDWVICLESGVIGQIIKFYKPTACEAQIMVKTSDGRSYHAPVRTWRPLVNRSYVSKVRGGYLINLPRTEALD